MYSVLLPLALPLFMAYALPDGEEEDAHLLARVSSRLLLLAASMALGLVAGKEVFMPALR